MLKFNIKYILLCLGLFMICLSHFFWGRKMHICSWLILLGSIVSAIGYVLILIQRSQLKLKVIYTLVIIVVIIIQRLTSSIVITESYKIFIHQHKVELEEVNSILVRKSGDVDVYQNAVSALNGTITSFEKERLIEIINNIPCTIIKKRRNHIYFGLFFWGSIHAGVNYWIPNTQPDGKYKHIIGKYYETEKWNQLLNPGSD